IAKDNILSTLLKLPDVVSSSSEVITEEEWNAIHALLLQAIEQIILHRKDEGKSLEKDLLDRLAGIEAQQSVIEIYEPNRRNKIKEGLVKLLEQHVGADKYDNNRLEQELIYYIEKIDISEEKVRLSNHLDYFKSVLKEADPCKGKKLSFILQEIGREINTTGSKANDLDIQKAVILMKDELEKAKEQILNAL
ncbi:MAG: YicC family protein, partial [Sediminibacterium sp.]